MEVKYNDFNIELVEGIYQKAELQEDGVTYKVDENKQYKVFQVSIHKDYFIEDREEALQQLANDLTDLSKALQDKIKQRHIKDIER